MKTTPAMARSTPKHYATPRQIQDLAIVKHQGKCEHISFSEGLMELARRGKLLTEKPPFPPYSDSMTPEEFDAFLLDMPFNTDIIIDNQAGNLSDHKIDEHEIFPNLKDIFCFKHLPYMSEIQHTHNFFELTLLYKGTYTLLFESESVTLSEGDLCIVPPNSPHNQPHDPDSLVVAFSVRKSTFESLFGNLFMHKDLVSTFFRHALDGTRQANYLRMKTELTPKIKTLIHQLAYECYQDDAYANSAAVSILNLLLIQMLRKYSDTITLYNFESYAHKDFDFALVLQYIQQHYRTVSLSSLARVFHFSDAYMSKLIQKHLNQKFVSLLRNLKMTKAQHILGNTTMNISEVSEWLGYTSVDHFSRTFKKTYGISPSHYRKEHG